MAISKIPKINWQFRFSASLFKLTPLCSKGLIPKSLWTGLQPKRRKEKNTKNPRLNFGIKIRLLI